MQALDIDYFQGVSVGVELDFNFYRDVSDTNTNFIFN